MSLVSTLYQAAFKRTSTYVLTIMVGAFVFERAFDQGADYFWEVRNRGVSDTNHVILRENVLIFALTFLWGGR